MSENDVSPEVLAASSLQRQHWLLQRLAPEGRAYHIASVFRLRGPLDVPSLRAAFADLVERHAILRTTLEERAGELVQRVHPAGELDFAELALAVDVDGPEVAAELARPFDLERGPLMRVRVWRQGEEAVLGWTMHHAITDLASKTLLAAELGERYAARLAGGVAAPPEGHTYAEFARWERAWLESGAAQAAEDHLAGLLADPPPPLALPLDHPRPAVQSPRGGRVRFEIGPALARALARAAAAWEAKPFLVLLTAYALLLSRYSGESRVVVGVPLTNRRREESQDTVGCFVNILPVPVDRAADPPFRDLMRAVRRTLLGLHRHQELPFERIVARVRPPRDPSRNPVFQAGFTFEPPVELTLQGLEVTSHKAHAGGAQLDVFMTLWPAGEGYAGQLEYCADLFDAATVDALVRNYLALLERLREPEVAESVPVSELSFLAPAERELVTRTWNATGVAYPGPSRMDELLAAQFERTPDALALRMGGRCWSYRELGARARGLAAQLRAWGVAPGDRVGLFMDRSFELVVSILGTILAGAAYVPIDPEHPLPRIEAVLDDARPSCVLTHDAPGVAWRAPGVPVHTVRVDELAPLEHLALAALEPDSPAYVIFTSGSTGRPKGVVNGHRGISNRILWMQDAFRLAPADVVLQKTPYGFDVSVWEFLWPLCVGAQLEVAPPGAHRDPGALARVIQEARVTTLHFVPSMLQAFLEHPEAERCRSVRRIVCSGEALGGELARRCCRLLDAELDNLYGPTEAAVDVSWWRCRDDLGREPVPIGRPIANTQLYVLDPAGLPVPVGVAGELHIGGVQVALGYASRPELTRERFVPDPFAAAPGARLYRTGDRARWSRDGVVEFLGRLDHQVKIRGLRIELGEIEAVLEQHPDVAQAVVVADPVGEGDARLVAYVVRRGAASQGDPRAFAAERLPAYMVPQLVVWLDRIPLSANGKVDRRALPAPAAAAPRAADAAPPRGELERWLLEQGREVFGNPVLGLDQNLFEAGGTSLAAAQLVGRIRRHLGVDVPLVRVFEHPTLRALASRLGAAPGPEAAAADPLAEARERAQRRRPAPPRPRGG